MSETDSQTEAERVLALLEELRTRVSSQPDLPDDAMLSDELVGVLDFFNGVGLEFPFMKRLLKQERQRQHKVRMGGNSITLEETILRAKVVAAINHLIKAEGEANEEKVRKDVAGYAGVDAAKAARWHKECRDLQPPKFSDVGGEAIYLGRIDCQIEKYRLELERKHNSMTPHKAVMDLFEP